MNKNNKEYWQYIHDDFKNAWDYYYVAEPRLKKNPDKIKEISKLLDKIRDTIKEV